MADYRQINFKLNTTELKVVHDAMAREGHNPEEYSISYYLKRRVLQILQGKEASVKVMKSTDFPGSVIE